MTLVVDSSPVVAALTDSGPGGEWSRALLVSDIVIAAHHLPAEVANTLRRSTFAGDISSDAAALAYTDLLRLSIVFFPYAPFANRVWELRDNVNPYDAWYVALAESMNAGLATLDYRLTRAPGPRCAFVTPP